MRCPIRLNAAVFFLAGLGCAGPEDQIQLNASNILTSEPCEVEYRVVSSAPESICAPYLAAGQTWADSARSLRFQGELIPRGSDFPMVVSSVFILRRSGGSVVFSVENAFSLAGAPCRPTLSNTSPRLDFELEAGDYEAEWIINGHASNLISFSISPDENSFEWPIVQIKCLRWRGGEGKQSVAEGEPLFLMQYTHREKARASLSELTLQSNWIQDGRAYPRKGVIWIGADTVAQGISWAAFVRPEDYGAHLSAGDHFVALAFGGAPSNVIKLNVNP